MVLHESNEARHEQNPLRSARTKDRNRDQVAPLEGIDSDVTMGRAQDGVEQASIGDNEEDIQAQDVGQEARDPSDVRQGYL